MLSPTRQSGVFTYSDAIWTRTSINNHILGFRPLRPTHGLRYVPVMMTMMHGRVMWMMMLVPSNTPRSMTLLIRATPLQPPENFESEDCVFFFSSRQREYPRMDNSRTVRHLKLL